MGSQKSKIQVPYVKLALVLGVSDYSPSGNKYKNLTNSAQNAFQFTKFLKKHGFEVTTNINSYDEVKDKKGICSVKEALHTMEQFIIQIKKLKKQKRKVSVLIYYSGHLTYPADTQEVCGVDSYGNLIMLQRYGEAFANYKNVFCLVYAEGVLCKEPKRLAQERQLKIIGSVEEKKREQEFFYSGQDLEGKERLKKGMSILYQTVEYPDIAKDIPGFIMSRQTHTIINQVNQTVKLDLTDIHILLRENYVNLGVADKDWKRWKIFEDLKIQEILLHENKRKYIGEVVENNKFQGFGIFNFINRSQRYEGEFKDGNFEGYGVYIWQTERQYYEGEWIKGKQEGLGLFVRDGGIRYEGEFVDGKFCGYGQGIYQNGDTYIGFWKDNRKDGDGIIYFEQGTKYKGQFDKGQIFGNGIMKYKNGDIYEGGFKYGKKDGKGKYKFTAANKIYSGDFRNDKLHGSGVMDIQENFRYDGEFKKNKMSGFGKMTFPNGCEYEGFFEKDQMNGMGCLSFFDGRKVEGVWENNTCIEATFYEMDGRIVEKSLEDIFVLVKNKLQGYFNYLYTNQIQFKIEDSLIKKEVAKIVSEPQEAPKMQKEQSATKQQVFFKSINTPEQREIAKQIVNDLFNQIFVIPPVVSDEELKIQSFISQPVTSPRGRLQGSKLENDIMNQSYNDNSGKRRTGVLDIRHSIKSIFQKYFREDSKDISQLEQEVHMVPTLSIKEASEGDQFEFDKERPEHHSIVYSENGIIDGLQDQYIS